jgi:ubiquinone biosynthesis protein UbiJ
MDALLASLLNRLLADQPEARARLERHAGKRLRLTLPLLRADLSVDSEGRLRAAEAAEAPEAAAFDCEIVLPPHVLAQLPLLGGEALNGARVRGDGVLAGDLSTLLRQLDWALVLAPYVGPTVAARADQALRGLGRWRGQAGEAVARSVAEYLVHEAGVLAEGEAVRGFVAEVDELREGLDRLAARLALLEGQVKRRS